MDSETSSEVKINYMNKKSKNISSDTDLYLNMLANNNKKKNDTPDKLTSLSELRESSTPNTSSVKNYSKSSSSSSRRSSSKAKFKPINLGSYNNNNSNNNSNTFKEKIKKELNPQEERMKKIELLRKLSEIKSKGYQLSRSYDLNSTIEEMEYEYELLKSFADKRNGIKLYKNILLNVTSVIEFFNDKYDPFSFKLSGWSEHMSVEVDSYDDVLEQLYEKYKGTGKGMPPEIKLLLLVLASASAFHFSKSTFSKVPGLNTVLKSNPSLVANLINPKKPSSRFMSNEEIHLEKQREDAIKREREQRNRESNINNQQMQMQKQQQQLQQQIKQQQQMQQQIQQQNEAIKLNNNKYERSQGAFASADFGEKIQINQPENVADILKRLHDRAGEGNLATGTTTQEESSNNDRIVSDTTLTEDTAGNKVSRRARKKKKQLLTII